MTAGRSLAPAVAFVLLATRGLAASPTDPANVTEQMETALNSGNVDAFLAWFAPQGRVVERGGAVYATREAILTWAEALASHNYRSTGAAHTTVGSKVTWTARVESDDLHALGARSVEGQAEAVVVGGKVVSYTPAFSPGAMTLLATASSRLLDERFRAYADAVYTQRVPAGATTFCGPQFVDHNPLPGGFPTAEGLASGLASLVAGFPDLTVAVDEVMASGDRVVARLTLSGTHKGPYLGAAATFRKVTFTAMEEFRMDGGTFVEHWGQMDLASLSRQLGVVDAAGAKTAPAPPDKSVRQKGNGGILGWLF